MITRHWKGITRKEKANEYIIYLKDDTFKKLSGINGFLQASIQSREINEGVEFLIITEWESFDAIKQFTGENFEIAVVPETVQKMMISFDEKVIHYEVKHKTKN